MEKPSFRLDGSLNTGIYTLKKWDADMLIGVETASGHWGLSTFPDDITIQLFNDNKVSDDGYCVSLISNHVLFVPNVNTENVIYLSEHLRVTDLEQTVVDMVRYKRHEFHLYETLISAIDDKMADLDRLERIARQYGVWERMQDLLQDALEAEEEDANA